MMPDRQEVASSLYGAWRLACLDESGMGYFNISVEGFWRSFFAAVLLAPVYMLAIGQSLMTPEGGFSFWSTLVHFITYAARLDPVPAGRVLCHRFSAARPSLYGAYRRRQLEQHSGRRRPSC